MYEEAMTGMKGVVRCHAIRLEQNRADTIRRATAPSRPPRRARKPVPLGQVVLAIKPMSTAEAQRIARAVVRQYRANQKARGACER